MMKIQRTILAAITLASTCLLNLSAFGQGALTPPGAPSPTMKSLDQIEARTAITNTSSLVTITQPGSYYLTHNLTVSTGDAIDIKTNGVTLDLNGFTIASTAASASGTAINLTNLTGNTDITIFNGHILGGVTNNGSGVYSGSGFATGINYYSSTSQNIMLSRITVSGCLNFGIYLALGNSTVVEACTVHTIGLFGISASTVKGCSATDCGATGIYGDEVSDSRGQGSGSYGIYTTTAQNCYGQSTTGTGFYASKTATGCYGYSTTGTGLYAFIANSCSGGTSSGTSLSATHNLNSY
jgi:hypothetical protein